MIKRPNPSLENLTQLVIENQKKIINKLFETIDIYKDILKRNGLYKVYNHLTIEEKQKIVNIIENASGSKRALIRQLRISRSSYYEWEKELKEHPDGSTLSGNRKRKFEKEEYKEAIFSILHAPPKDYGYNRTTWRIPDIHSAMKSKNLAIGKNYIIKIIKNQGFRFRTAKKVLTSTDPEYKEKLKQITAILSTLGSNEKFFSIDEYGPFAIKMQGGKSRVLPGQGKIIQQFQKSKGWLIMTGALELSTNQMTHFYSTKKDTDEMIRLLDILVSKYSDQDCIYFSWDAASWHASKKLYEKVEENNKGKQKPKVKLAPLPACAQFLNVIESVFSGMSRAIIHNSNYQSVEECKEAIDRYFEERNTFYQNNPKRAGNKLWGKERVEPKFSESNNCKDPKYLHNFK